MVDATKGPLSLHRGPSSEASRVGVRQGRPVSLRRPCSPRRGARCPGLQGTLVEAVMSGWISPEAAQIIHATRVGERSIRSEACRLHSGEATVRQIRHRAERAMVRRHARARATDHRVGTAASDAGEERR